MTLEASLVLRAFLVNRVLYALFRETLKFGDELHAETKYGQAFSSPHLDGSECVPSV